MQKVKKKPLRMCLGCNEMKDKRELIRIVRNKDGDIFADPTSKAAGRGAYICRSVECLNKAKKSRRLEKTFSCRIPDEVYDAIERELNDGE